MTMDTISYIFLLSCIAVITVFLYIMIIGKAKFKGFIRYISFISIIVLIISIFSLNSYYKKILRDESEKFEMLQSYVHSLKYDSAPLNEKHKKKLLDSLNSVNSQLNTILLNIKDPTKITGKNSNLVSNVKGMINKNKADILKIESYNDIIDNSIYGSKLKQYISSGNTSNFIFQPPLDTNEDYLDFLIKFQDEHLVDKIEVIYLEICKNNSDGSLTEIFAQFYKPKKGVNAFKIKNYFKGEKNVQMTIGYFLKGEIGYKKNPVYNKITYSL
jgi:hypothetical protein